MPRIVVVAQTTAIANETEQGKLSLGRDQVLRVTRTRSDSGRTFAYEELVLPLSRFPGLATDVQITHDVFELARRHGVTLGTAKEQVRIVKANGHVAERLDLEEGVLVLKLDRVVRTADGLPIEWRSLFALQLVGSGSKTRRGLPLVGKRPSVKHRGDHALELQK